MPMPKAGLSPHLAARHVAAPFVARSADRRKVVVGFAQIARPALVRLTPPFHRHSRPLFETVADALAESWNDKEAELMRIPALVITVMLAMPAAADTYRSVTTGNVNLRAGAGGAYERITTLPRGTEVSVDVCQRGWCLVDSLGVSGWVSSRYLFRGGVAVETYRPPVVHAPPVATFDFVVPRDYHDFGYSRQHMPGRDLHGRGRDGLGR